MNQDECSCLAWRRRINERYDRNPEGGPLWVGVVFLLGAGAREECFGYVFAHHTAPRLGLAPSADDRLREALAQKVQRLTQELNLSPDQQKAA